MSVATSDGVTVEGQVSPGFEAVREAFAANFGSPRRVTPGRCLSNPVLVAG